MEHWRTFSELVAFGAPQGLTDVGFERTKDLGNLELSGAYKKMKQNFEKFFILPCICGIAILAQHRG